MAHHGSDPFDGEPEGMKKLRDAMQNSASFRGALGDFPEGQLTKSDEGAVQFAIGVKDGKVVLDFGTPCAWVGMTPQQAADLAGVLLKRAREAGRLNGEVITVTLGK